MNYGYLTIAKCPKRRKPAPLRTRLAMELGYLALLLFFGWVFWMWLRGH